MPHKFSVIVPTCHRGDLLARCLESLSPGRQTAPTDSYEVIVTDDALENTAEGMIRRQFPWVRWVRGPARGPAANRNSGARYSSGEWLCFTDDDCVASKEWIAALHDSTGDAAIDLIEGRTIIPDGADNPFLHGIANENGGVFWACNIAIRRETFLALGGFDEDFLEPSGEDIEFAERYHTRRFRSQFCPEALIYHPVRPIGWGNMWQRLLMTRWSILHAYKADKRLHLSAPPIRNVLCAATDSMINHLRRSWRDLRRWNQPLRNCRWFWFFLRWITYPVILPYQLYWVYRFQKQFCSRRPQTFA